MSISAPRYSSGPLPRASRAYRTLAIAEREIRRRGWWATVFVLTLTYLSVDLEVILGVELAAATGALSLADFGLAFTSSLWPFLILIVATTAGAGTIAEDIGGRTISLYLSRPIRWVDYLIGKTAGCGTWLLVATIGPGLVAVIVTGVVGIVSAPLALAALGAFAATGLVTSIFFTGLALALSSFTGRGLYAGVALFGLVLSLAVAASVVAGVTGNAAVLYVSPVSDLETVAQGLFRAGATSTSPTVAAVALVAVGVLSAAAAGVRLSRIEVIGE